MKTENQSIDLQGKAVSSGIGIGSATILSSKSITVRPDKIDPKKVDVHLQKLKDSRKLLL